MMDAEDEEEEDEEDGEDGATDEDRGRDRITVDEENVGSNDEDKENAEVSL